MGCALKANPIHKGPTSQLTGFKREVLDYFLLASLIYPHPIYELVEKPVAINFYFAKFHQLFINEHSPFSLTCSSLKKYILYPPGYQRHIVTQLPTGSSANNG